MSGILMKEASYDKQLYSGTQYLGEGLTDALVDLDDRGTPVWGLVFNFLTVCVRTEFVS